MWSDQAKLAVSDMEASAYFGTSVALEADTVVAGTLDDDRGNVIDAGVVCMVLNSGTLWSEEARLVASEKEYSYVV